jgi:hypothetical protein
MNRMFERRGASQGRAQLNSTQLSLSSALDLLRSKHAYINAWMAQLVRAQVSYRI